MPQGSFLYYVPNVTQEQVTRAFVAARPEAVPLFDLVHSPRLFSLHCQIAQVINGGPDGGAGAIFSAQPVVDVPTQKIGYYQDHQKWQRFGEQWVGWDTEHRPGPESLRRPTQIDGYETELADGLIWTSPTIRAFEESRRDWTCNLPVTVGLTEDGQCTAKIASKYSAIWMLSGKLVAVVLGGIGAKLSERFGDAVECLSVNYRIGQPEATILEMFDTESIRAVLRAAIDADLVDLFETKAAEAPENPT